MAGGRRIDYDVVISYAGPDRDEAVALYKRLRAKQLRVFYDREELGQLIGKNLINELTNIYQNRAFLCVMLVSTHYSESSYTYHERQAAQKRDKEDPGYIFPIKLDEKSLPDMPDERCFVEWHSYDPDWIAEQIHEMLSKRYRKVVSERTENPDAQESALLGLMNYHVTLRQWRRAIELAWRRIDILPRTEFAKRDRLNELPDYEQNARAELAQIYVWKAEESIEREQWKEAIDPYQEAKRIYQEIGDRQSGREISSTMAQVYERLAESKMKIFERADAVDYYRSALNLYKEIKDPSRVAQIWHCLGEIRDKQDRNREAIDCFLNCLQYGRDNSSRFLIPLDTIRSAHDKIINIRRERGEFHYIVLQLCEKARDLFILGEEGIAIDVAKRAYRTAVERNDPVLVFESCLCLGDLCFRREQVQRAIDNYEKALRLATSQDNKKFLSKVRTHIEDALEEYWVRWRRAQRSDRKSEYRNYIERLQELTARI